MCDCVQEIGRLAGIFLNLRQVDEELEALERSAAQLEQRSLVISYAEKKRQLRGLNLKRGELSSQKKLLEGQLRTMQEKAT